MADPFTGEIRAFCFNYPPVGWAFCDGAQIPFQQYQALSALIGKTYGGDGVSTIQLPDLRDRAPIGAQDNLGHKDGAAGIVLTYSNLPEHDHAAMATTAPATATTPTANLPAASGTAGVNPYIKVTPPMVSLAPAALSVTGGGAAHENRQPYLGVNFCICFDGIYPVPD